MIAEARKRGIDDPGALDFFGIGGPRLRELGLRIIVDSQRLSAMGFVEVLTTIPKAMMALLRVGRELRKVRPDIAILLDYPDFHLRLGRRFFQLKLPAIYYIPPKVWAWRPKRIQKLKKYFVSLLSILPFEEEFFRSRGVNAKFIGNPIMDELPLNITREDARVKLELKAESKVVVLMPGSRLAEWKLHLPVVLETSKLLALNSDLRILMPFPAGTNIDKIKDQFFPDGWSNLPLKISTGNADLCLVAADVALIKSGTSSLEAAILGCPHLVFYRPHWLSAWIFKKFVKYRGPVSLVNLIAGAKHTQEYVVPEFLFENANARVLVEELQTLLRDQNKRNKMTLAMRQVRDKLLTGPQNSAPSENAASEILDYLLAPLLVPHQNHGLHLGHGRTHGTWYDSIFTQLQRAWIWSLSTSWSFLNLIYRKTYCRPRHSLRSIGTTWSRNPKTPRVISIGNIQAGGTGKTPLTAAIANQALSLDQSVCILSRGYRSQWEKSKFGGIIAPFEKTPPTLICGDEPALLRALVPGAWIGVGRQRESIYQQLKKASGKDFDLALCDDGFQYLKLKKDLEIVTLTSASPATKIFREFPCALYSADLVVWTKGNDFPKPLYHLKKPWVRAQMKLRRVLPQEALTECSHSPNTAFTSTAANEVWSVSGLADNETFVNQLIQSGLNVSRQFPLQDHERYRQSEVLRILQEVRKRKIRVAISGKDWVKWRELELGGEDSQRILVFETTVEITYGKDIWEHSLSLGARGTGGLRGEYGVCSADERG